MMGDRTGDSMGDSKERAEVLRPSRRAALKAGIGVGVGVAAWSGPTITSLGGTPAYAAGCTFIIVIDLAGGCRNTDQGNCGSGFPLYSYHTLKQDNFPTQEYFLTNNVPEGTCCSEDWEPVLHFPEGITCTVTVKIADTPQCTGSASDTAVFGPSSDGELEFTLSCLTFGQQNYGYTILATCNTTGAPEECLNP